MAEPDKDICHNITNLTAEVLKKLKEGFCDTKPNVVNENENEGNGTPVVILVYYPILIFAGIILNTLVILTIFLRQRLHTVPNAFMVSLSVADFLMASIVVPLRLSELSGSEKGSYYVADILFPLIGVASIFSLCSVTLDRYIHIRSALNYEKYMNKTRACVIVASIWIFSIFQSLIFLFMKETTKEIIYNDVRMVLCFCLPALLIVAVYAKLFLVARAHARVIASTIPSQFPNQNDHQPGHKKDFKIIKVVALIVGTFFVCWLPFFVLISYELHSGSDEHSSALNIFLRISESLVCSTTIFNPLLYGFLRRDFRRVITNVATCRKETSDEGSVTTSYR